MGDAVEVKVAEVAAVVETATAEGAVPAVPTRSHSLSLFGLADMMSPSSFLV